MKNWQTTVLIIIYYEWKKKKHYKIPNDLYIYIIVYLTGHEKEDYLSGCD